MDPNLEPITPNEAVELYLTEKQPEFADATLRSHRSRLGHFREWCGEQEITNLNTLTGRDLYRYRHGGARTGTSHQQAQQHLNTTGFTNDAE